MAATLIYNPVAGKSSREKQLQAIRGTLERLGIPHCFKPTRGARDGTRLAKEAVSEGSDLVIAVGGDGTVNEVVNGLVGSDVKLALIPLGTGNLAAHEFGIPPDPVLAAEAIPKCRVERIDVGKANDRYFLMMVSIGLDAKALRDVPKWAFEAFHWWAFFWTGLFSLFRSKQIPFYVKTEKETIGLKTRLLVISNIKGYGLPGCQFFSNADSADGLLDCGLFKSQSVVSYLGNLLRLGEKRPIEDRLVHHHRFSRAEITTEMPISVQLDGDFYGYTPLTVSVVPKSLSILAFPQDPATSVD
ncbi:MAG: diacylglycerol kinase family protein [Candidatus Omnitrophota bacterium]